MWLWLWIVLVLVLVAVGGDTDLHPPPPRPTLASSAEYNLFAWFANKDKFDYTDRLRFTKDGFWYCLSTWKFYDASLFTSFVIAYYRQYHGDNTDFQYDAVAFQAMDDYMRYETYDPEFATRLDTTAAFVDAAGINLCENRTALPHDYASRTSGWTYDTSLAQRHTDHVREWFEQVFSVENDLYLRFNTDNLSESEWRSESMKFNSFVRDVFTTRPTKSRLIVLRQSKLDPFYVDKASTRSQLVDALMDFFGPQASTSMLLMVNDTDDLVAYKPSRPINVVLVTNQDLPSILRQDYDVMDVTTGAVFQLRPFPKEWLSAMFDYFKSANCNVG